MDSQHLFLFNIFLLHVEGTPAAPLPRPQKAASKAMTPNEIKALIDEGLYKEATEKAIYVSKQSKDPTVYNLMGIAYGKQKKYKRAVHAYKRAIKQKPQYWEAYEYLGVTYLYLKKPKKTEEIYHVLEEKSPRRAAILKDESDKLGFALA